jgi:hypothetical protein
MTGILPSRVLSSTSITSRLQVKVRHVRLIESGHEHLIECFVQIATNVIVTVETGEPGDVYGEQRADLPISGRFLLSARSGGHRALAGAALSADGSSSEVIC